MANKQTKFLLDRYLRQNNFIIDDDPVGIPHRFSKREDVEIAGFFAAILAWGQRKTIINKCNELLRLMDDVPHDFVLNHSPADLEPLLQFKHRTFNPVDLQYFLRFLGEIYRDFSSLEDAFIPPGFSKKENMERGLIHFYNRFAAPPDAPSRTMKHIGSPHKKARCKRLNMYLRWMVRKSEPDFGLWQKIAPSQLLVPLDVHVERVSRRLGLLKRKQGDWQAVLELTENLKELDAQDPVKYDLALFSMGVYEQ